MVRRPWRIVLLAAAVIAAATALGWWILHPRVSDRQLIEDLVARVERGVEAKSADEIMACVAPDYRDPEGLDRTEVWKLVMQWVRSPDRADVAIQDYSIDVKAPAATGEFDVQVLVQRDDRYELPIRLQFTVQFEKQWRRWRKVWLVKSVAGPPLNALAEDFL